SGRVERGQRRDGAVEAGADGGPRRARPARDVLGTRTGVLHEVPSGVERGSGAVVEDAQGVHRTVEARAERGPRAAVPPRDVARGRAARRGEIATDVEGRARTVVEDDDRPGVVD